MTDGSPASRAATRVADDLTALRRDGYVVLREQITPHEIEAAHRELAPFLKQQLMGRNEFEGLCSERVYAVLAKAPSLAKLVEHPRLLGLIDDLLLPNYLLSAAIAINVHPGETAQAWHNDDGATRLPRPRDMFGVSAIWALDDFTASNGATEVIPGSHLWDHERPPAVDDPRTTAITMPAGSVVVFAGSLYHRGGANTSRGTRLGFTPQYCQPWMRQIETMVLAVPPEHAQRYSPRLQELLGYSIAAPSFIGYVDGRHPRRLVDPQLGASNRQDIGVPGGIARGADARRLEVQRLAPHRRLESPDGLGPTLIEPPALTEHRLISLATVSTSASVMSVSLRSRWVCTESPKRTTVW